MDFTEFSILMKWSQKFKIFYFSSMVWFTLASELVSTKFSTPNFSFQWTIKLNAKPHSSLSPSIPCPMPCNEKAGRKIEDSFQPFAQCQLNKIPNLLPFQRDLQKNLWKLPNGTTSEILRKQTKTNTMQTGSSFHIINQNILTMNQFLSQCVCAFRALAHQSVSVSVSLSFVF